MTTPISLRALLEVEARVRQASLATQADLEAMSMFGRRAREAARPLCEALQEAIAALEAVERNGARYYFGDLATDALEKIRTRVVE